MTKCQQLDSRKWGILNTCQKLPSLQVSYLLRLECSDRWWLWCLLELPPLLVGCRLFLGNSSSSFFSILLLFLPGDTDFRGGFECDSSLLLCLFLRGGDGIWFHISSLVKEKLKHSKLLIKKIPQSERCNAPEEEVECQVFSDHQMELDVWVGNIQVKDGFILKDNTINH